MTRKDKVISIRVNEALSNKLKNYAKEAEISQSSIVSFLLEVFLYGESIRVKQAEEFSKNATAILSKVELDSALAESLADNYRKMIKFLDDMKRAFSKAERMKRERIERERMKSERLNEMA